jgi:hypothetical protein
MATLLPSLLLLAFGWTNPAMLAWLAAAAVPVVIHLWSRRKHREQSWAAMEYLLAAMKRQRRRIRLEQWLLLLLRTVLVVLIVAAVAEPYVERAGFAAAIRGNTHHMLVLDGSYSMGYQPTDRTRFERAKELARQMISRSPQGDAFTLVLMASPPRAVVATPTLEAAEIIREIDNLRLSHTPADLPATLRLVRQIVDEAGREQTRLVRHEVYFLTDLQRGTWAPKLATGATSEFLRQSDELAASAVLSIVDVGQPSAENLAVTSLRITDGLLSIGRRVALKVEIKNFGHQAKQRQPLELMVDGRRIERQELDVAAGALAARTFTYRFATPGDHRIEARAAGDGLEVDNHRFLAVTVRLAARVLCIEGRPAGRPFRGSADYVAAALATSHDASNDIQVERASEMALMDRNLDGYDCLFLCNVAQFTAGEASVLGSYLRRGGSLVFFLGDQVSAESYNRELGGSGAGGEKRLRILPANIGRQIDRPQFRLDPLGYRHALLRPFREGGETSLLTTPVFKYYQLLPSDDPRMETVVGFIGGDPLVVESAAQRGRVLMVATSAEPSWSGLPFWPSFVPLVQEMVSYGVLARVEQRNLMAGMPLKTSTTATAPGPVRVRTPDGETYPARVSGSGDQATISYADTSQSGIYTLRPEPPGEPRDTFAVNVDTRESDLEQVSLEELRNEVWPGIPFEHQTSWQELGVNSEAGSAGHYSRLPIAVLYVVLGLLFVETFVGWKMAA